MKIFSMHIPSQLYTILDDLVRMGHFHNRSHAAKALMLIGLVEYLKQYYAVKEAKPDVRAPTP